MSPAESREFFTELALNPVCISKLYEYFEGELANEREQLVRDSVAALLDDEVRAIASLRLGKVKALEEQVAFIGSFIKTERIQQ